MTGFIPKVEDSIGRQLGDKPEWIDASIGRALEARNADLLAVCQSLDKMMDEDPFDFAIAGAMLHRVLTTP